MEALAAERGDPCDALPGSLRWNARQLLQQGDVQSIREVADRLDGKPAQQIGLSGDPDNPIVTVSRIELVAPGYDDSKD